MKKICLLVILLLQFSFILAQDRCEILSQTKNSVTVRHTVTTVDTYKRVETPSEKKGGYFGISVHGDYNFGYETFGEFGGSLFYNFCAYDGKSKIGVDFGFDYGVDSKNDFAKTYWDIRAGLIAYRYIGFGGVYGKSFKYGEMVNDGGAYVKLYLPLCKWFGLSANVKWTKETYFSVGGGVIIQIPIKNI